jgi:hypothetical protein
MVFSPQDSPPKSRRFEFGQRGRLCSLSSLGGSEQVPQTPTSRRHTLPAPVEILGIELFLDAGEDVLSEESQSESSSSSSCDSDAPDSIDLIKNARQTKRNRSQLDRDLSASSSSGGAIQRTAVGSDTQSTYSSMAKDSLALHRHHPSRHMHITSGEEDGTSSSDFEDDMEDSLQYGYSTRCNHRKASEKRSVPRRFSVQASDSPIKPSLSASFKYNDTMKRRSSIDNGNIVLFSPAIMGSQLINNGGANAAA